MIWHHVKIAESNYSMWFCHFRFPLCSYLLVDTRQHCYCCWAGDSSYGINTFILLILPYLLPFLFVLINCLYIFVYKLGDRGSLFNVFKRQLVVFLSKYPSVTEAKTEITQHRTVDRDRQRQRRKETLKKDKSGSFLWVESRLQLGGFSNVHKMLVSQYRWGCTSSAYVSKGAYNI